MIKIKKFHYFLVVVIIFLTFGATRVEAVIFETAAVGPKSGGMVGALVATADDPIDSLFFNPATLSQVKGTKVAGGMGFISWPVEYESPTGYKETSNTRPMIPYLGYTTDKFAPFYLGIGTYSNFGAGFEFDDDPSHGVYGEIRSIIGVVSLNPTVAYQINHQLVVAIQANIAYTKAEIDLPVSMEALRTDSEGFGFGGTVGLLYKPIAPLSIGLKWRSQLKFSLDGDATLSHNKGDDFKLYLYYPQAVTIGIGYALTNKLTLELDYTWYDWSYFGRSRFSYDTWDFLDGPMSKGMKDCYRICAGAEYSLKSNIALWTGYFYNRSATKENWITPIAPDISNHNFGLGVGFEFGDFQIGLSLLYTYIPNKNISVSESESGFPGKYRSEFFDLITGITYQF